MQKYTRRMCGVILSIAIGVLAGCGKKADDAPSAAAGTTGTAAPTTAKPGYIVGKITRPDGSLIGIAGAKFTVRVNGVAGMGNNVSYSPQVDANGNFSLPLASGIYHLASASMTLPFAGEFYCYDLVPTTMTGDTQSDAGIVSDFVWKISGPLWSNKDNPDPTNFTQWYGGCCTLQWDGVYRDAKGSLQQFEVPVGAKFDFTATPQGKLIDGSDGKPIIWHCNWVALGLTPTVLNDMPACDGGWHITGQETDPDGKTFPILFESAWTPKYVPTAEVHFKPDRSGAAGFWPPPLMITRPAP